MKKIFPFLFVALFIYLSQVAVSGSSADNKTITISSDSLEQTIPLQGQQVVVDGNHNTLQLTGIASKLVITGNDNTIDIDTVSGIIVSGDNNFVTWRSGGSEDIKPMVIDRGGYNNVGKR